MKKESTTRGSARAVRLCLGGTLIAGLSVIGVGTAAGSAGASATQDVTVHAITVPVHCMACLNPQPLPP